jgi:hypothetical protein
LCRPDEELVPCAATDEDGINAFGNMCKWWTDWIAANPECEDNGVDWELFRSEYPHRLCLLIPYGEKSFSQDAKSDPLFQVNSGDEGSSWPPDDWEEKCGLNKIKNTWFICPIREYRKNHCQAFVSIFCSYRFQII